MENLISMLPKFVKDPVELTGITLPSAALVLLLFVYKEHIHPALSELPDPRSGSVYGALLFIVITLFVSVVLKRVSHDLLNLIYDKFYRDLKRKKGETWFERVQRQGLSTNDPLRSKYEEALTALKDAKSRVVEKIELLETQSKLARSVSLILFLMATAMAVTSSYVLAVVCLALSAFMLYVFFKGRWEASELVYQARWELK